VTVNLTDITESPDIPVEDLTPDPVPDPTPEPPPDDNPDDEDDPDPEPVPSDATPEPPPVDSGGPDTLPAPAVRNPVITMVPGRVSDDLLAQPALEREMRAEASPAARPAIEALKNLLSGVSGTSITDLIFLNQRTDFLGELDDLREDVDAIAYLEAKLVGSTVAVTTGLSVGYVIWLTRGGLLIASLLSSMPAWRLIDPLPILARLRSDDEEARGDEESLDSLVSRGSAPERSKLGTSEPAPRSEGRRSEPLTANPDDVPPEHDPERRGAG
jgi:hypothetical protein